MIALIQRVNHASVRVEGELVAAIDRGMLVLLGVERNDNENNAKALFEKLCKFRIFADKQGKMNENIIQSGGQILLVPQFTLPAETKKGNRPGFDPVADPVTGQRLFETMVEYFRTQTTIPTETGVFQADMKVLLENDGPLTFWLQK